MMGTQIMIFIIGLVIPTVLFGALQVFLAGRKNKWPGLVLPVCSLLITAVMVGSHLAMGLFSFSPYDASFGDESLDDVRIYIEANVDEWGNVTEFRDLRVKNTADGKTVYYPLEFDSKGNLIGGEDAMQYRENIERITDGEQGFTGKSLSKGEMRKLHVKEHFSLYAGAVMICAVQFIPSAVYLVIYVIMRKRVKRKFAVQGIEKMMIDDL